MRAFFVLIRIITVGLVWSLFFLEGVRVIMLKNWRFDIIKPEHWQYAKDLWLSGWVISDAKEWAFVLILLTFIPLWLTGWAALSMVSYSKFAFGIIGMPLKMVKSVLSSKTRAVKDRLATKTVVKRKSHKQVRPPARDGSSPQKSVMDSRNLPTRKQPSSQPAPIPAATQATAKKTTSSNFDHALFDFDTSDDGFDFDLDAPVEPKKSPVAEKPKENKKSKDNNKDNKDNRQKSKPQKDTGSQNSNRPANNSSIFEVIKEKGYNIVSSITIKNTLIDFIGFSQDKIVLFLVDKEHGDWLADEEKFNGEEPLWFSENSHRISPVRKVEVAREALEAKLSNSSFNQDIEAYVINQMNNIINAEDMFDIWKDLNVKVVRIDRGTPKEIPLFSRALEEADEPLSKDSAEKLKKLLRGAA